MAIPCYCPLRIICAIVVSVFGLEQPGCLMLFFIGHENNHHGGYGGI